MARIEGIKRVGSLLITLIWALPTLTRQRQVAADDEKRPSAICNRFERIQTVHTLNDVLIFGIMLWVLVSYIN